MHGTKLSGDDRFVSAVEEVYAASLEPSRWKDALQRIADCTDDIGALLLYGRDDEQFGYIMTDSLTAMVDSFFHEFPGEDLRAVCGVERGVFLTNEVVTDFDLVTPNEIETHPFYRFMATHGLRYHAAAPILQDFRINITIAVQRSIDKAPFSEDELQVFWRLARHVEKALLISTRLMNSDLAQRGLGDALSRLKIGVFVLDALARVTFSNPAADRHLGDGLQIVESKLRFTAADQRSSIAETINRFEFGDIESDADLKPILVHRARAERPLVAYLLPISRSLNAAEKFLTFARAILLIMDPEAGDPADPAVVRDVLGLTLGEARIAALVGSGVRPRAAAEQLGITEETARTVLKRVFLKTGVSRQSELTALLSRLALR